MMLVMAEDKISAAIHGIVDSGQKEFKELYAVGEACEVVGSPGGILNLWNEREALKLNLNANTYVLPPTNRYR